MTPAFSYMYEIPPPPGARPARNGMDYDDTSWFHGDCDLVYSPDTAEISPDMGLTPKTLLENQGRVRGSHPIDSFAALGPCADELISGQTPLDVYAPFRELAERGGYVLLAGVELNRMTLIHFAEARAGRELFMHWANGADGQLVTCRCGGCSEGFTNLNPNLEHLAIETTVGSSLWRAFPAQQFLNEAAVVIADNPEITHCGDGDCRRCRDAVAGGPILIG